VAGSERWQGGESGGLVAKRRDTVRGRGGHDLLESSMKKRAQARSSYDGNRQWSGGGGACNALNLGVEFFLLFTHQIQVLLPFLFPFRSFFPISKQNSDWCPYRVKTKPKCHGCCIMLKHISLPDVMFNRMFVSSRCDFDLFCVWIPICGCACRGFLTRGATQPVTEPPKSLGPPTVVLVQRTSNNPVGAPELLDKFCICFSYLSQERFTRHADITNIRVTRIRKRLHKLTFILKVIQSFILQTRI
jgi:hypothetical protein